MDGDAIRSLDRVVGRVGHRSRQRVGVDDPALVPASGTLVGQVRISVADVPGGQTDVAVRLDSYFGAATAPPYGVFDTPPPNGAGAVPLTGWALDDVGVASVALYRNRVTGEGGTGLAFIGNGSFTDGARPDVAAAFPAAPQKTRAGWGYMLLSNVLPGGGDGTFTFHAFAVDSENKQTLIGSRDVTVVNSTADQPFGALDAPAPGAEVSGTQTFSGWVVAPHPMQINLVNIILDGQAIGLAQYGLPRPDVGGVHRSDRAAGRRQPGLPFHHRYPRPRQRPAHNRRHRPQQRVDLQRSRQPLLHGGESMKRRAFTVGVHKVRTILAAVLFALSVIPAAAQPYVYGVTRTSGSSTAGFTSPACRPPAYHHRRRNGARPVPAFLCRGAARRRA